MGEKINHKIRKKSTPNFVTLYHCKISTTLDQCYKLLKLMGLQEECCSTLYPHRPVPTTWYIQLGDDTVSVCTVVNGDVNCLIHTIWIWSIVLVKEKRCVKDMGHNGGLNGFLACILHQYRVKMKGVRISVQKKGSMPIHK